MTPFVLLHFLGSSHREWGGVRARLAPDRPVLAIDLPGFGDAAAETPLDVAGMADLVDAQIVDSGFASCVVVGHSMSGKVAALLAARRPDYLRGLVLVAASPPSPEPMADEARRELLAYDGSRTAAEAYVDGVTANRLPHAPREIAVADAMCASLAAWNAWVVHGSQEDCSAAVGVVSLPTCVIVGAGDRSLGEDVQRQRVMPHFPQAGLAVIGGGHALPLENAPEVHRRLDGFIEPFDAIEPSRRKLG